MAIKKAGGKGKQKKVFPENSLSGLLALSESIGSDQAAKLDARAAANRAKVEARDKAREKPAAAPRVNVSSGPFNLSQLPECTRLTGVTMQKRAEIKAALKATTREKARKRKEARKGKTAEPQPAPQAEAPKKKRKSVTFALP